MSKYRSPSPISYRTKFKSQNDKIVSIALFGGIFVIVILLRSILFNHIEMGNEMEKTFCLTEAAAKAIEKHKQLTKQQILSKFRSKYDSLLIDKALDLLVLNKEKYEIEYHQENESFISIKIPKKFHFHWVWPSKTIFIAMVIVVLSIYVSKILTYQLVTKKNIKSYSYAIVKEIMDRTRNGESLFTPIQFKVGIKNQKIWKEIEKEVEMNPLVCVLLTSEGKVWKISLAY